jgi:hypothetical protein
MMVESSFKGGVIPNGYATIEVLNVKGFKGDVIPARYAAKFSRPLRAYGGHI